MASPATHLIASLALSASISNILSTSCCTSRSQTHRLRAGALPWQGRVEVKKDGVWGTVYDDTFGQTEANIACRAAGFGSAIATQTASEYGRGIGQVHYQNLRYIHANSMYNTYMYYTMSAHTIIHGEYIMHMHVCYKHTHQIHYTLFAIYC